MILPRLFPCVELCMNGGVSLPVKIQSVEPGSFADKKKIKGGDTLLSINGHDIYDVLDYRFYANAENLSLRYLTDKGKEKHRKIRHLPDVDSLGLCFDTYLMDQKQHCRNRCIFCFVDQMPPGMRDSLYFKDDDSRLSFFFGNYITLTAISEREVQRIIDLHISPINISVHTMDPDLRVKMMGNPKAGQVLSIIDRFCDAGIQMNTQLVLCPGINDGAALDFSLDELSKRYPAVQSIAAVPVGLTAYRSGLPEIESYKRDSAREVLRIIQAFNEHFSYFNGRKLCYPADEFYLLAGFDVPDSDFYDDFSQLENGVGLWAMLRDSFFRALAEGSHMTPRPQKTLIATGVLAYPLLHSLAQAVKDKFPSVSCDVIAVENHFFGSSVTVAGLITGKDLLAALKEYGQPADTLLLTSAMLKSETEPVFLDDVPLEQVEAETHMRVQVIPETDGAALLNAILGL